MQKKKPEFPFLNKAVDRNQLKRLIIWAFRSYGIARAANMADQLKDLGFLYATKAGISLSLEDLRIPNTKQELLEVTMRSIAYTDVRYKRGEITAVERFQKVIDTWNSASDILKKQIVKYFTETDPLNSIYMMAFSGARANISQVRQLVGMRGLMSDPQGQIIDLPISSNFREGLTITDYFISCYGARKGLVDTALRTADSGYLTRRLVDVAQDVIVREFDCKTSQGILLETMTDNRKVLIPLKHALIGRVLAEDILNPVTGRIVAKSSQEVDPVLADKITEANVAGVLVRSPITCSSVKSVCQLCYGWNLAHGKMVDLGEAIGIIAAQSIGEPGTQLTMRTFHTGGVFTGELEQVIRSPGDFIVEYPSSVLLSHTRTSHGEHAFLVKEDSKLSLIDLNQRQTSIPLTKGSLLLVENHQKIRQGQVIIKYPANTRIATERAQKAVLADFSGSVYLMNLLFGEIKNDQKMFRNVTKGGIIWILSGQVYRMPNDAHIVVRQGDPISENSLLASTHFTAPYSGQVKITSQKEEAVKNVLIVTSSKTFTNIKVDIRLYDGYKNYILVTEHQDHFILKARPNKNIVDNQLIADLITNIYRTTTGGIIKYLDLSVSSKKTDYENKKDYYDILGGGYVLWIPEETHEINKDISLLLIQHGEYVEAGAEIVKNIFANSSGVLDIFHKDGIIREIIIKPGMLHFVNKNDYVTGGKSRGFLRFGEVIIPGLVADKLVYWEYFYVKNKKFILIRPVVVYSIPDKSVKFTYSRDSFAVNVFALKLVKRIQFRDGERIKSVSGVDILKTHLVAQLSDPYKHFNCSFQIETDQKNKSVSLLKFITANVIPIKDNSSTLDSGVYAKTRLLVENNQYIESNMIIAKTEIFSSNRGKIVSIQSFELSNRRILLLTDADIRIFPVSSDQNIKVKSDDWIYAGDEIAASVISCTSGRVISVKNNQITLHVGQPYLISNGSFLHVDNNTLVQRGENVATLIFERVKTRDIVQGLPRIEEILEARRKSDLTFNPHILLEVRFHIYFNQGLALYDATRLSLLQLQLYLVKEVQSVYQSQGVEISDKHIEVIVRQMTSKIRIENGGDTNYLPGEIVELQKIESVNSSLRLGLKREALYYPILLGITKASLNTESFISAASFQETTKVLTEAAISGKLDWLRGLKENVIIGRLIPAGTGFNVCNISNIAVQNKDLYQNQNSGSLFSSSNFEDIIVDDRTVAAYPAFLPDNDLKCK
uniref:DNA-directed RNA polymerase subunit beta'' n=1 Tax=Melanthalia intermedia TaxID=172989 RepID=A0A345UAR0_9FLOR|nr:RNA polymerase b''-subunit [Melanthalia intermedia]AXI97546.1 RNA polymerase b''-subunit [Melanthalia intermedia]